MKMSANLIGFLSFLLFFGIMAGAQLFIDWYLPSNYEMAADIIKICAPIIIAVSGANLLAV
jgi:O-antigen/teichoic acid export membrane protein